MTDRKSGGANFVVWTMQRSGGTSFTSLLASMHEAPAIHEPFTGRRAGSEFAGEVARMREGVLGEAFRGRNFKHCYELASPEFNETIAGLLRRENYAMILLERNDEIARAESLALAKLTGAYGIKRRDELYPGILSGEIRLDPIDIAAARKHFRRCLSRQNDVRALLREAGALQTSHESVFRPDPEETERRIRRVAGALRGAGASLEETPRFLDIKGSYISERKQGSSGIASHVPNIEEFRAALAEEFAAYEPLERRYPEWRDAAARSVYVDLGANVGDALNRELERGYYDEAWAFEPNPNLIEPLRARFENRPVKVVHAGAWTRDGNAPLYLGHVLSSTMVEGKKVLPDHPQYSVDYSNPVSVPAVDFAQWLASNTSPQDRVTVKMDIEGAEFPVLDHLVKTGMIDRIQELRCEFHDDRFPVEGNFTDLKQKISTRTKLVNWR